MLPRPTQVVMDGQKEKLQPRPKRRSKKNKTKNIKNPARSALTRDHRRHHNLVCILLLLRHRRKKSERSSFFFYVVSRSSSSSSFFQAELENKKWPFWFRYIFHNQSILLFSHFGKKTEICFFCSPNGRRRKNLGEIRCATHRRKWEPPTRKSIAPVG